MKATRSQPFLRSAPANAHLMTSRSFIAAGLSCLLPGLGQLHNKEIAKGVALLCTAAGLLGGLLWSIIGPETSRSWLSALLLAALIPLVWLPAILDAHQRARGLPATFLSDTRRWYVVMMLLSVGPMAVPLLWQSPGFSRAAKVSWTIVVLSIALAAVALLLAAGPEMERWLKEGSVLLELPS